MKLNNLESKPSSKVGWQSPR